MVVLFITIPIDQQRRDKLTKIASAKIAVPFEESAPDAAGERRRGYVPSGIRAFSANSAIGFSV